MKSKKTLSKCQAFNIIHIFLLYPSFSHPNILRLNNKNTHNKADQQQALETCPYPILALISWGINPANIPEIITPNRDKASSQYSQEWIVCKSQVRITVKLSNHTTTCCIQAIWLSRQQSTFALIAFLCFMIMYLGGDIENIICNKSSKVKHRMSGIWGHIANLWSYKLAESSQQTLESLHSLLISGVGLWVSLITGANSSVGSKVSVVSFRAEGWARFPLCDCVLGVTEINWHVFEGAAIGDYIIHVNVLHLIKAFNAAVMGLDSSGISISKACKVNLYEEDNGQDCRENEKGKSPISMVHDKSYNSKEAKGDSCGKVSFNKPWFKVLTSWEWSILCLPDHSKTKSKKNGASKENKLWHCPVCEDQEWESPLSSQKTWN